MWWLMFNIVLAIFLLLGMFIGYKTGFLYNLLNGLMLLATAGLLCRVIYIAISGDLNVQYFHSLIDQKVYWYWLVATLKTAFYVSVCLYTYMRFTQPPTEFAQHKLVASLILLLPLLLVLGSWIPFNTPQMPLAIVQGSASVFIVYQIIVFLLVNPNEGVLIQNPFKHDIAIVQGGNSVLFNHHYLIPAQQHALDIVFEKPTQMSSANEGASTSLYDYPCFAKELWAPITGEVVIAKDSAKDVAIGESDIDNPLGNHLVLKISKDQYVLMAHLKQGSIKVNVGDIVAQGRTVLAECGNSGNTTEPHLHIQIQDKAHFKDVTKTYPIIFEYEGVKEAGRAGALIPAAIAY